MINRILTSWISGLILTFVLMVSATQSFAQTPFSCTDGVSYIITGNPSALSTVNLRTGALTPLLSASTLGNRNLTGLGYNPQNNFLYASVSGTNDIVRIASDGTVTLIDVPGLPVDTYEAGDVAPDGTFYLYSASATTMYKVNLATLAVSTIAVSGASVQDISITPNGLNILGISAGNGNLIRWPISGGALTQTAVSTPPVAMTAATFMDRTGDLFVINAANSITYEVSGPTFANSTSETQLSPANTTALTNTDGARCVTSLATTQPAFGCQPNTAFNSTVSKGYSNALNDCASSDGKSTLLEYNLNAGAVTNTSGQLINDFNARSSINNLGYNPTDNYLWAYRTHTNQLVRIGLDRSVEYFAIPGLVAGCGNGVVPENTNFFSGDINSAGVMYLLNGVDGDRIVRVDLNPASPTYLTRLSDVVLSLSPGARTLANIQDMAFNPIDNQLYTVSANNNLIRINPSTGAVTVLGTVTGIGATGPGYVVDYFDSSGTLYIKGTSAPIYKIPNVSGGNLAGSVFSNGPVTSGGDGARCPYSVVDPPLPVSLVSFQAQAQTDRSVLLTWTTSWERVNKGYIVERSKDLLRFEPVGEVSDVAGTSTSLTNYRFVDANPYRGTSYYRLRQVDLDGSSQTFKAEAVVIEGTYGVYPNPVTDQNFTLNLDEPTGAVLHLYNASGQEVKLERKIVTELAVQIVPTTKLTAGVYVLTVEERAIKREYRVVVP